MSTLTELSIKYGTDKQPKDHNYMPMYEHWIGPWRDSCKRLLEIGYQYGKSARMWHEYFVRADCYFIDFLPQLAYVDEETGRHLIVGNQTDPEVWAQIPGGLDFVIDDGSHEPYDVLKSLALGWDKLRPGGLWFIEDTHCNFTDVFSDRDVLYPWLQHLIYAQQANIGTGDFYKVREGYDGLSRDLLGIHSYKSVILLEKAQV